MNILELTNFSCGYPGFHLNNISFQLEKGRMAGIIGPNGSGKTTLFKGITGILPCREGEIRLNGKNIKSYSSKEKARLIAVVSQFVETGNMTVEEYVLMGRIPYSKGFKLFEKQDDLELADYYMKLVNISKHRDKLMTELSGGEQQLAGIARALTQQPQLLLLDEPTSHLDISHQVQILNLIRRLNQSLGITVLLVIHDLNLAGEYCDELILFEDGRVHTKGKPEEVLTYTNIENVYNTLVVTGNNPVSGKPVIFLVSESVS
jgi:iron complex transport system ATP-binding protein